MPAIFFADGRAPRWRAVVAVTLLLGLVLGVLGPFGSYLNDGPLLRAGYWVGAMLAGLPLYGASFAASRSLTSAGWRAGGGGWALLVVSVLAASVPEAILTRLAACWIWPALGRVGPGWATWYAQVVTIGLVTVGGTAIATRALARPAPRPAEGGGRAASTFAVAEQRRDVIALQMEDHYVRLHTVAGSELILMPLSRAIELVAVDGLRTHRSWWVARHAVERVEGTPRSMSLRLTNGIVAPVSRSSVASLRAAGWV